MIIRTVLTVAAAVLAVAPLAAEEAHRELGAHVHGHSKLNIAIEGDRLAMELEAPGADIVGFEHAAESAEDKAALARAEATLQKPLALFVLPEAAGCTVESAAVEIEHGAHAHAGEHEDEQHAEAAEDEEHEDEEHAEADHDEHEGEAGHSEFHAAYDLACADADRIDGIDFAYFATFPGAREVEVTIITETAEKSFEVERDQPRIELQGLM